MIAHFVTAHSVVYHSTERIMLTTYKFSYYNPYHCEKFLCKIALVYIKYKYNQGIQYFKLVFIHCLKMVNLYMRGYSSVVEHSTADREVHGSTPCVP